MSGLILKDFLNMKKVAKQYILILGIMILMAVMLKSPPLLSMYMILMSSMLILTSFSYDEAAHFEKYAMTFPVSREILVQSKYVLFLILILGSTFVGIVLSLIMNLFYRESSADIVMFGMVCGSLFLILYSVCIPVVFKRGVEKARLIMLGVFGACFVIFFGGASLLESLGIDFNAAGKNLDILIPVSFLAADILALLISYSCSLKIISKKEW